MQDNDEALSVNLKKFICYAKKVIRHRIMDLNKAQNRRNSHEFLPDDGDLLDAPSMQEYLSEMAMEDGFVFIRSDGKGEPMRIYREDLAQAIETLLPTEKDFLIKFFQEELPMPLYAAEAGISTSMAYRRKKAILRKLSETILRGVDDNEGKNQTP